MKKFRYVLRAFVILLALVSFGSCEALFSSNIFDGIDTLDLSNMSSEEKADAVLDDPESALENLDDEEVEELIDDLEELYSDDSEDDSTQLQAAAAVTEILLTQTGADDTINNLSDLATDMISGDLTVDDPGDILTGIFSDESGDVLSEEEIVEQLTALQNSLDALEAYGNVLGDDGNAPEGVDPDSLAVTAMVVGLVDYMMGDDENSIEDIAAAISTENTDSLTMPSMDDLDTETGSLDTLFGTGLANTIEGSDLLSSLLGDM